MTGLQSVFLHLREPEKIVQYEGGYTDYMNKRPQPASGKTVSENASSTGASASGAQGNTASDGTDSKEARKKKSMETWGHEKKLKFTYKEQKRVRDDRG